jgi:ribosome biogenesis protein UTP30
MIDKKKKVCRLFEKMASTSRAWDVTSWRRIADYELTENQKKLRVPRSHVSRAVDALATHLSSENEKLSLLLERDEFVDLVIGLKRVPTEGTGRASPIALLELPNSIWRDSSVCVLVGDDRATKKRMERNKESDVDESDSDDDGYDDGARRRKVPDYVAKRPLKEVLAELGIEQIKKVLTFDKLRTDYKQYEFKRQLCASYDLFLADTRLVSMLAEPLGQAFFRHKKVPVPVLLHKGDERDGIELALNSTPLFVGGNGVCVRLHVARANFDATQIVDNIMATLQRLPLCFPRGWDAFQSLSLCTATPNSPSLPFFCQLPDPPAVEALLEEQRTKFIEQRKAERKANTLTFSQMRDALGYNECRDDIEDEEDDDEEEEEEKVDEKRKRDRSERQKSEKTKKVSSKKQRAN